MKTGFLLSVALLLFALVASADQVAPLLANLESDDFLTRQKAAAAVAKLGLDSFADVRKHAAKHKDAGVRRALDKAAKLIAGKAITQVKAFAFANDVGHAGWVSRSLFSPDGKFLITGGVSNIRVWEVATGKLERTFNQGSPTWALSLSPDKKRLAVAGKGLRIFNWENGKLEGEIPAHTKEAWGITYSKDGKRLYSCALDASFCVSDVAKLTREKTIPLEMPNGRAVLAAPGGILVSQKVKKINRGMVTLIDPATTKVVRTFGEEGGGTVAMALSSDHKLLVTVGFDHNVILWDFRTGKKIRTLKEHRGVVEGVAFAPDGKILTVGSRGVICLWDPDSDKLLWSIPKRIGGLLSINFTPDGRHFVTTGKDGAILLWRYGFVN